MDESADGAQRPVAGSSAAYVYRCVRRYAKGSIEFKTVSGRGVGDPI
jgi:hypothetical protein